MRFERGGRLGGRLGGSAVSLLATALLITACAMPPPTALPSPDVTPADASPASSVIAHRTLASIIGGGPERLGSRPATRPAQPSQAARFRPVLVDDHCVDRDLAAPPADDPVLTVLDRSYALAAGYAPDDLVPASRAGLVGASGTKLVRSALVDDLAAMRAAWDAAGLTVVIDSAYRSYGDQATTFDSWVARLGLEGALLRTARPGHSEHQLGTAIDVSSPGWAGRFGDWATESAEGAWMAKHAWEYGFVMSYPPGGQERSCFGYEPWHYRWIGREAAAEHRERGGVLRDLLVNHVDG